MENLNQVQDIGGTKKKVWVVVVAAVALILVIGGVFVWESYLGADAQRRRQFRENYDKAEAAMSAFEKAMREDTYGGKTPQETLNMFIDALEKGDVELASKYFMLDTNTQNPDYLTRNSLKKALEEKGNDGGFNKLISLLGSATSTLEKPLYDGDFGLVIKENGKVISDINFGLNKYSQVWKIESM